jgi:3-oxoacyl-[acyl-carrier-protein] synthase II
VSGIDVIPEWNDVDIAGEKLDVVIGGQVKNFKAEEFIEPKKDIRRMDRFIQFAIAAGKQAWQHAGLPDRLEGEESERAGTIVGVGLVGLPSLLESYDTYLQKGPNRVSPFFIPSTISNLAPGHLAIKHNLRNANWTAVSACASGNHAIGEAFMHIREGRSDVMLCGGAESAMHPIAVAGFDAMHALCASKNDRPKEASRPFEKNRDGFVMGEGCGMLVLEEFDHARKRGATMIAEIVGFGSTSDAFHITAPAEGGEGAQRAMQSALRMGGLRLDDVGYINAHGTSTPFNDLAETQAIKEVFGDHASHLMVSSTKSMTGHLLGAAGGVEAIFSALTLQTGIIPPTINYVEADPECDLDYVPNIAREKRVDAVLSNSFGFGGTNAVLAFRRI